MKLTMRQLFYITLVVTAVSAIFYDFYQQEVRDTVITLRLRDDDTALVQSQNLLVFLIFVRFLGGFLLAVIASIRFRKYPLLVLFFAIIYCVLLIICLRVVEFGISRTYEDCIWNNGINYSSYCSYIIQSKESIQSKLAVLVVLPISGMFWGFSVSFIVSVIAYIFRWVVKLKRRASPDDGAVID